MFKKIGTALLAGGLVLASALAAQDPQTQTEAQPQAEPQSSAQETAAPAQRVPGRAGSPQEADAWAAVMSAATLAEKATLAEDFLSKFPDSGLTPNAHYLIAMNDYQSGQVQEFIRHAEITLTELPQTFDLLSHLAFYYAELHQPDKAIERANAALTVLDGLQKPPTVAAANWVNEMAEIRAEVNYALGRAYLERSFKTQDDESKANLQRAIDFLRVALENQPKHDFANFRMATAVRNTGDVKGTLMYYGRCVAIGGTAAEPARQQIENVLEIVNKSLPDSEWAGKSVDDVVAAARLDLLQSVANSEAERNRRIQLLNDKDTVESAVPVPATEGTEASPPPGK